MTIGEKIKKMRKEKKLTQAELAKKIGISVPTLQRYENGVTELKASALDKIAKALELAPAELVFDEYFVETHPDEINSKSITVKENGATYYFSVTADLTPEEIKGLIKTMNDYIENHVKNQKQ